MSKILNPKSNFLNNFFQFNALKKRNQNIKHINQKIYYLLCQPETFLNASKKISKNTNFLTKKLKKNKLFFFNFNQAKQIAQKFKDGQYEWDFNRIERKKSFQLKKLTLCLNLSFFL